MATTLFTDNVTVVPAAWLNDVDAASYIWLSSVAGTNTITATGPSGMTAYAAGQKFLLNPAVTNTGATTLNITPSGATALGAKNIFAFGAAVAGGELVAGAPVLVVYDGTQFNVVGPVVRAGTWTPGLAFGGGTTGITYASQAGSYTKIGRLVVAPFTIILSEKGSSTGAATLSGLSFTPSDSGSQSMVGECGQWANLATALISIDVFRTDFGLFKTTVATTDRGATELQDSDFTDTSTISGTLIFHT